MTTTSLTPAANHRHHEDGCDICGTWGGTKPGCGCDEFPHRACDDCQINGKCYLCFIEDDANRGIPTVHRECRTGLWVFSWLPADDDFTQTETFGTSRGAYLWAAEVLTGIKRDVFIEAIDDVERAFAERANGGIADMLSTMRQMAQHQAVFEHGQIAERAAELANKYAAQNRMSEHLDGPAAE